MSDRYVHSASGSFLLRTDNIAGYTYDGDNMRPEHLVERMIETRLASPAARSMGVEEVLDQIAEANVIDRTDESTFDSGDFPKVVFVDQLSEYDSEWYGEIG